MYAEGRGTAQDLREAERWLSKSAEQGYAWAADLLNQIQSKQQIETLAFTEAKVENDFFLLEDNTVSWAGTSNIVARFVFKPRRDLKVLLTQDWLTVNDEHGNNYEIGSHSALFEKCGYDFNVCLEKDFRKYEGGKDVNFNFRINPTDRERYKMNRPRFFNFLIKFLVFRPDGNLVEPVAIRVPLRS